MIGKNKNIRKMKGKKKAFQKKKKALKKLLKAFRK